MTPAPALTAEERRDWREKAELMAWAESTVTEPWDYAPDVQPGTAYAGWVRACSPDRVLALLAENERLREALELIAAPDVADTGSSVVVRRRNIAVAALLAASHD